MLSLMLKITQMMRCARGESELAVDIVHRNQYKDNYVSSPASIEQMAVMPTFYVLDQSRKKNILPTCSGAVTTDQLHHINLHTP